MLIEALCTLLVGCVDLLCSIVLPLVKMLSFPDAHMVFLCSLSVFLCYPRLLCCCCFLVWLWKIMLLWCVLVVGVGVAVIMKHCCFSQVSVAIMCFVFFACVFLCSRDVCVAFFLCSYVKLRCGVYFCCPVLLLNCVASLRSLRRSCALCLCSCVA